MTSLRAPFPWFGGKSRVAHLVWDAFGDVPNYVEPFAGSLAVLLGRPGDARVETVNDLDCYLANFWRAVAAAPNEVATHADWPVNEADLHARHRWLVAQADFRERMRADPEFYDARVAGWWVWGICQWIGGGWCATSNWGEGSRGYPSDERTADQSRRPSNRGMGVHSRGDVTWDARPAAAAMGMHSAVAKRPQLTGNHGKGMGVHRARDIAGAGEWEKRPALGRSGRGVQRNTLFNHVPLLAGSRGAAGRGVHGSGRTTLGILAWMSALSERLRRVRVVCGDWARVTGPAVTTCIGTTGVLLDPPYADTAERDPSLYSCDSLEVAHQVREWAIEHGDDPALRIALCGYEGEHEMPESWRKVAWKANGGYGSRNPENKNRGRERIWFSPHCLGSRQRDLFAAG